ncbi:MAG: YcgL domain-containing protein [Lysobacteraceae bacterium]
MLAFVYKSLRKDDTYLYLRERDGFGLLPQPLLARLGALDFVMELDLAPPRRLARADAAAVREALDGEGYYLQLPPTEVERLHGRG